MKAATRRLILVVLIALLGGSGASTQTVQLRRVMQDLDTCSGCWATS